MNLLKRKKKGNLHSKSKYKVSVIQNVDRFFDLREKIIDFFRDSILFILFFFSI